MKTLNEAELLSIQRLRAKKVPLYDIADRIGITVPELKKHLAIPNPFPLTPYQSFTK